MVSFSSLARVVGPLITLFLCSACAVISGTLQPPVVGPIGEGFQVGTTKVDLTPMPGFAMAGHSIAGKIARGYWTRLYARVIYIQDNNGESMVLVSCDLLGIPGGLVDRVAELVRKDEHGQHIGRGQIILAATHTHQAPGNFFTAETYNSFASRSSGFDKRLFDFFAQRISQAILQAVVTRRPAMIQVGDTDLSLLARNRSFDAFRLNPESGKMLRDNSGVKEGDPSPFYPDIEAFQAVYPKMTVLTFASSDATPTPIAVAAFLAVHATAMGHETEVYNSDLFGVAATLAERALSGQGAAPVVAIFNGAEGDVSPYWKWRHQDRSAALRLGPIIADGITRVALVPQNSPTLDYRFEVVGVAGQCLAQMPTNGPWAGRKQCTAKSPTMGAPGLGGAKDGQTVLHDLGFWKEGVKGARQEDGQGAKQPALDFLPISLPFSITHLFMAPSSVPSEAPLGVYRIGTVLLVTLPGEFTTVMGRRIVAAVQSALKEIGSNVGQVLLVGLANEYISYTTTPEEYEAQDYEGASTLYGPIYGPLISEKLSQITRELKNKKDPVLPRPFSYKPGDSARFGIGNVGADSPQFPDDGLASVVQDEMSGVPRRDFPAYCWDDGIPEFPGSPAANPRLTPQVAIETSQDKNSWHPLLVGGVAESDTGLDFVTVVVKPSGPLSRWCTTWLRPSEAVGDGYLRFKVTTIDPALGPTKESDPF